MPEAALGRAVAALQAVAPDLDATALAEALWLATRMAHNDRTGAPTEPRPAPAEQDAEPERAPEGVDRTPPPPTGAGAGAGGSERALHERLAGTDSWIPGDGVAVSRAAGLPLALEATRALRPWKRTWTRGRRRALDIDATVDGYARSGELIPAFTAAPERWFDLTLVVDGSPAMQVWQETIADFTAVLDRLGAFRTLQIKELTFGDMGPELRDGQHQLTPPGRLRSADGRRLVVAVSDCAAAGWRQPAVWRLLRQWSATTPVALLNPLPPKLWRRTGLDLPAVRVAPGAPGSANSRLDFDPPPLLPDEFADRDAWQPIPVLSLSPHSLDRWSRTVMRSAPEGCGAVLVPPGGRLPGRTSRPSSAAPDARAESFLRTATPAAARLAVLCSAFDRLSMHLVHLIRQEMVPKAGTSDLAELFTSGLFPLGTDAGGTVQLVPSEPVRRRLRRELTEHEVWRINRAISRHVSSSGEGPGRLPSVAYDPEGGERFRAERQAFGHASRQTLELLGLAAEEEPAALRPAGQDRPVPDQLPKDVDAFVGRERPLAELTRFLTSEGSPVVSLAARGGQAGAGKTALAVHAAHRLAAHFPDGRLFVDLQGAGNRPLDPSSVLAGFLRALGVAPDSLPASLSEQSELYRATVAGRRLLIVLDNAHDEHQVAPLLPETRGCAVLITSRRALTRLQTHALQLGPLDDQNGVRLLRHLLRPVAERTPNIPDHDEAMELVRCCGGWPLPIELIAKSIAGGDTPPVGRLLSALRENARAEDSIVDAVLQTCLAHLDSGLLPDFVLLAQPDAGPLSYQEAGALLGRPPRATVEPIDRLVERGFLQSGGPARYHDAVRRFARGRATADVRSHTLGRLLDHYCEEAVTAHAVVRPGDRLAHRLGLSASAPVGPPDADLERLMDQCPNLLPVLASDFWTDEQLITCAGVLLLLRDLADSPLHGTTYRRAVRAVVEATTAADTTLSQSRARVALAHCRVAAGFLEEAEQELARAPYDVLPDQATTGLVDQLRGAIALRRGHWHEAAAHFSLARSFAEEEVDPFAEATALRALAQVQLESHAPQDALRTATTALRIGQELGHAPLVAHLHYVIGRAWHDTGYYDRGIEELEHALQLFETQGDRRAQGRILIQIAKSRLAADRVPQARDAAEKVLERLTETSSANERADASAVLRRTLDREGRRTGVRSEGFVLLDEQRPAYEAVLRAVRQAQRSDRKEVVVVTGGPGSGKTVIAVSLLGELYRSGVTVLHATGSRALTKMLRRVAGGRKPKVQKLFKYFNGFTDADRNGVDVLICDEAHAIRVTSNHHFTPLSQRTDKPQIEELIDAARVPVFLLDEQQVVRPGEMGTVEYIKSAAEAKGLGCRIVQLDGRFRSTGSDAYREWVDRLLGLYNGEPVEWQPDGRMQLAVADSPLELEVFLAERHAEGFGARMSAGYCWQWTRARDTGPEGSLPLDVRIGDWARPWNVYGDRAVDGAPPLALWATDPAGFGQVGCVYAAQSFEYDWSGVILGPDLVWRGGRWITDRTASKDPAFTKTTSDVDMDRFIRNAYRVLLTRGMAGTVIYSTDDETRSKLRELAGGLEALRPSASGVL